MGSAERASRAVAVERERERGGEVDVVRNYYCLCNQTLSLIMARVIVDVRSAG